MKTTAMMLAGGALLAHSAAALAQTVTTTDTTIQETTTRDTTTGHTIRGPRQALELGADLGYTQGFGSTHRGNPVSSLAGPGVSAGLDVGYRISPELSIGATGRYQAFNTPEGMETGARSSGVTAGIEATIHARPYSRVDPWLSLGTGYRMIWNSPENGDSTMTHGFELGRVELGLDLRPSSEVSVSPVIGADLNLLPWQSAPGSANASLPEKQLNTFIYAGVKGRFDIGGNRETAAERIGRR